VSQEFDRRGSAPGLRERKKARTRTEIQRQAIRLFCEQGFQATTVEQIAEAAEVAPSTVFRYFARKEDLAVLDEHYSLRDRIVEAFREQPRDLSAAEALRGALHAALASLSPADRAARLDRNVGMLLVPEVWAANVGILRQSLDVISELLAERAGRHSDDPAIRTLTAATFGVGIEVVLRRGMEPDLDLAAALDESLAHLSTALTL
jgi:AcrR family transcriptional regulator